MVRAGVLGLSLITMIGSVLAGADHGLANALCPPRQATMASGGSTYVVLAFTAVGTCNYTIPPGVTAVDYLVVGGGGGGKHGWDNQNGGGGGAVLTSIGGSPLAVTPGQVVTVSVGAGGSAVPSTWNWTTGGQASQFVSSSYRAAGGESGSNGRGGSSGSSRIGGSPNDSGTCGGYGRFQFCGGGGGGAAANGGIAGASAGSGGAGQSVSIIDSATATLLSVGHVAGASVYFGGGGGGGSGAQASSAVATLGGAGSGGLGGGGAGAKQGATAGVAGRANSGGGGGSGGGNPNTSGPSAGGAGGSGVVLVRYAVGAVSEFTVTSASGSEALSGAHVAGTPIALRVSALDSDGRVNPAFTGTVSLTSPAWSGVVPAIITDGGVVDGVSVTPTLVSENAVVAASAGAVTTAMASGAFDVTAGDIAGFEVTRGGSTDSLSGVAYSAGEPVHLRVRAVDAYGNTVDSFAGAVHLSSEAWSGVVPTDITTGGEVNEVVVTPTALGSGLAISVASNSVTTSNASGLFTVVAGPAASFTVTRAGSDDPLSIETYAVGTPFKVRVAARDLLGNVASTFSGDVTLTSTAWSGPTAARVLSGGVVDEVTLRPTQSGRAEILARASGVPNAVASSGFVVTGGLASPPGGVSGGGSSSGEGRRPETAAGDAPVTNPSGPSGSSASDAVGPPASILVRPATVSASDMRALAPATLAQIPPLTLQLVPPRAIAALDQLQVAALSPAQVAALTPRQLRRLGAAGARGLTSVALSALDAGQVTSLTAVAIGSLTPRHAAALLPQQVRQLRVAQLVALTPVSIAALRPATLAAVPARVVARLTDRQIGVLTRAQIRELSVEQLRTILGRPDRTISAGSASAIRTELIRRESRA